MDLQNNRCYGLIDSELNSNENLNASSITVAVQDDNDNANTALSEMEKYSHSLLEVSLDSIISIGLDGKVRDVNAATENATGLLRDKLIGTDFAEYFTDPNKTIAGYQQVFHDGKIFDYELGLKNIAGYSTPVLCRMSAYKNTEGIIIGVFATARDITNIRKIEDELIYLKNNLDLLIKKRAAELVVTTKDLAFQSGEKADRAAELIVANKELAFQSGEKADRAAELVNANKELAFQNSEKDKRAAELIIANIELAFQSKEKEKRASELINANRELVFQKEKIKELNDELELRVKDRTAQLESANIELESLSYSISHDLKAPLRHITGYVSLLAKKYWALLPDDGRHYLDTISGSANNMGQLIDGLLQFSRIGRIEINQRLVNMNEIVDIMIQPIIEQDLESRIKFSVDSIPSTYGDIEMMKSVWSNLIENAVKFTQKKELAQISIGAEETNDKIIYYIKDNGAGFDMQYATKLFTVFHRLHALEDYDGTGVGLATVQRIINRHGGTIWAVATVGEGATFRFSLNKRNGKE